MELRLDFGSGRLGSGSFRRQLIQNISDMAKTEMGPSVRNIILAVIILPLLHSSVLLLTRSFAELALFDVSLNEILLL